MKTHTENFRQGGFTLLELVIVISLLGLLSLFTFGLLGLNAQTFNTVMDRTVSRWEPRKAIGLLRNELQGIDQSGLQAICLTGSGAYLRYLNDAGQQITFRKTAAGALQRQEGAGAAWNTIITHVRNNPFTFLDENLDPAVTLAGIVYIGVELNVEINEENSEFQALFFLRN